MIYYSRIIIFHETQLNTLYSIIATIIISLISIICILFIPRKTSISKFNILLISIGAGSLLGAAFTHMIPESLETATNNFRTVLLFVLIGMIAFFILEKFISWRHCHIPSSSEHPHKLAYTNIIGDALHNFLDGIAITSAFLQDTSLGIATSIAIIMHEIPQEISDFGILLFSNVPRRKAILFNFLSSLSAVIGVILMILLKDVISQYIPYLIAFSAGGFIYIASADLIPELHKETSKKISFIQFSGIIIGIIINILLSNHA